MWSIKGCRVDISVETLGKITKIFGKPVSILTGYLQAWSAASTAILTGYLEASSDTSTAIHFGNLRIVLSSTTYVYLHEENAAVVKESTVIQPDMQTASSIIKLIFILTCY
jgi:hypothetical protein